MHALSWRSLVGPGGRVTRNATGPRPRRCSAHPGKTRGGAPARPAPRPSASRFSPRRFTRYCSRSMAAPANRATSRGRCTCLNMSRRAILPSNRAILPRLSRNNHRALFLLVSSSAATARRLHRRGSCNHAGSPFALLCASRRRIRVRRRRWCESRRGRRGRTWRGRHRHRPARTA